MFRLSSSPLVMGFTRFCFGLAKKTLLAAPMGGMAAAAFDAGPGSLSTFSAWMGIMAFAFQTYFLLSGYADMAVGVAEVLGVRTEDVFHSPYQADGITDFWKRWSLPVAGLIDEKTNTRIGVALTMLIGALWLGASWSLVLWGGIHLGLLALEQVTGAKAVYAGFPKPLRVTITFFILLLTWVFFRAGSILDAVRFLALMFGAGPSSAPTVALLDADMLRNFNTVHFVLCALILWAAPNARSLLRKPASWKPLFALGLLALSILMSTKESGAPELVRQQKQALLIHVGGEGNEVVHVAAGGWLFAKADIAALCGRGPLDSTRAPTCPQSSVDAMLGIAARFKKLGLPLLLVPVPTKTMIYPEHLSPEKFDDPVHHHDQLALHDKLRAAGADVVDLAPEMWRLKLRRQVFLQQDTHWTPDAMKIMAEALTKHIRGKYPQALKSLAETPIVDARLLDRASHGDLVAALDLAAPDAIFPQEQVTLVSIVGMDPRHDSPVTVIGDSFASVFDDPALGFAATGDAGASTPMKAGFGNQLAVLLNQPLDVIADSTGSSISAMRDFIAQPDEQLAKKKLVIWLLSANTLLACR